MRVVATRAGKYGQMRKRGDRFSVANKQAFSQSWMVEEGSKEANEILAELGGVSSGLTPEQIAAEEALATGRVGSAEVAKMKARIAELEADNERLTLAAKEAAVQGTAQNGSGVGTTQSGVTGAGPSGQPGEQPPADDLTGAEKKTDAPKGGRRRRT